MKAFHGNQQLKNDLIAQLQAHYEADEIVKGQYWENGKGCAVGCCIHSSSHTDMSEKFNIPVEICYLIDSIFEGLPNDQAKEFPLKVINSIKVGSDLSKAWNNFAVWLLIDPENGVIRFNSDARIIVVADLHARTIAGEIVPHQQWAAARDAAGAAAGDAAGAAAGAARAAAGAAAGAARAAARAAAWAAGAARAAARAAAGAARAAARAAAWDAAWDARDAAWDAAWDAASASQAASLVKILREA